MMRSTAGTIALLLTVAGAPLVAQTVSVTSSIDRSPVGLNEQFTLSISVSGTTERLGSNPDLPDMSAFAAYLGSSSAQSVQIINGRTLVSYTLQYRYQATAVGSYTIGPVSVLVGGKAYRTQPIRLEISKAATVPGRRQRNPSAPQAGGAGTPTIGDDDLFLKATVSKHDVYENEPVVVEYKIYTQVAVTSYSVSQLPSTTGFWAEDFPLGNSPETHTEVVGGRSYTVATLKKMALFPTGVGKRTIDPMVLETEIRVRRRSLDPFDDFFRSPLFDQTVSKVIASKPFTITVRPLPARGRPAGFSGLVGKLNISASIDKVKAETNEALTLKVKLSGEGNMRTLPEPKVAFPPDVETYPPKVEEKIEREGNRITGTRNYEYVFIPRAPGKLEIPRIRYSYFDRTSNAYKTVATRPITVDVTGDVVTAPMVAGRVRGEIQPLREDIRFIRTEMPALRRVDHSLFDEKLFWVVLLVPLVSISGALAGRRHLDRLQGDLAYARHRRASRLARKRMAAARALAREGNQAEFYAEAGRALLGFLGDKLNIAEAGFISDEVRAQLRQKGVSERAVDAYFECIAVCDLKRFSPSAAASAEMLEFIERTERAMSDLDGEIAR
ncbi:MAG: BatD family protein [Gemmatimonadales bacterium]